jgi:hypothetical protein
MKFIIFTLLSISLSVSAREFRVLGLSQLKGLEQLEFRGSSGIELLPVSVSSFSNSYAIPQSGVTDFYLKVPEVSEAGEEPSPLFSITFPVDCEDVIVLLRADAKSSQLTYKYMLIDDSVNAFPAGAVMVLNLMNKSLYARLGDNNVKIESGKSEISQLVKRKNEPFNGGVIFAAEFDDYGKIFSKSSWYLIPSMKIFCVVFPDENLEPQIRKIRLK